MVGGTGVGDTGASAYARAAGIKPERWRASGADAAPEFGEISVLDDPKYAGKLRFGLKGTGSQYSRGGGFEHWTFFAE